MQKKKRTSMWIENVPFDWTDYCAQSKQISLAKHQTVFGQEEPVSQIYVVLDGRVRLSITNKLGEEKAIMIIGKNGIVGDLGLYATDVYLTSAITVTPTQLLVFSTDVFRNLIEDDPHVLQFYLQNVGMKFQVMTMQIVELSYRSARARVLQLLIQLAQTYGVEDHGRVRISIRFTQQEMANVAGTSRVTVAQVFQLLKKQKVITKENGYIFLSSMETLEQWREAFK
jgi:CRP-like cAMP-binding protein